MIHKSLLLLIVVFLTSNSSFSQTFMIGTQVWSSKNLDVVTFRNGDTIAEIKSAEEWNECWKSGKPAWCYYENDSNNGLKYGKLYNWFAVNDSRGLAPEGWHIPNDNEWDTLIKNLGGEDIAGKKMKKDETISDSEDSFLGLPGGFRQYDGGFYWIDVFGYWWSSSGSQNGLKSSLFILYFIDKEDLDDKIYTEDYGKDFGLSVRCIKD